jgi:hypothetical protein
MDWLMPLRISDKVSRVNPSTLRSVAERRIGDAQALAGTRSNAGANGVIYLAGIAIEILLKAKLIEQHSFLRRRGKGALPSQLEDLSDLVWKYHSLDKLLYHLPQLRTSLKAHITRDGRNDFDELKKHYCDMDDPYSVFCNCRHDERSGRVSSPGASFEGVFEMTGTAAQKLASKLKHEFGGEVEVERVSPTGLYRFSLLSKAFNGVPHLKRQDRIWEVVKPTLTPDQQLDISLILAYAPDDITADN